MRLILVGAAWLIGIFSGSIWHLDWIWLTAGLWPIPLALTFKSARRYLILLTFVCLAFLGGMVYYPFSIQPDQLQPFKESGAPVDLSGTVISQPEILDNFVSLVVSVHSLDSRPVSANVLVYTVRYPEYQYGDQLNLKGRLEQPPAFDGFDYQSFLAREGIFTVMSTPQITLLSHSSGFSLPAWVYKLRRNLAEKLAQALPEPQAGLAQGMFLGLRSSIPSDLRHDLSITGTTHLIAISGINLSIIAAMVLAAGLRLFGRRHYFYVWISLAVVWFYSFLSGLQAPVVRAAIMATLFLCCELLGRQKWAAPALFLSAAVMVAVDPQLLWSTSFQLSFLAMAGLIFIAPVFQNAVQQMVTRKWDDESWVARLLLTLSDSFCVSLGAALAIWPILACNFKIFSFAGFFTTFLISPVLAPIIIFSALTALIGLGSLQAARIFGWVDWLFLTYMLKIIDVFAAWPLAAVQTSAFSPGWARAYYIVLVVISLIKEHFTLCRQYFKNALQQITPLAGRLPVVSFKFVIIPLLAASLIVGSIAVSLPDKLLHVSFLDVGEGDAVLIRAGGRNILIDGGPSPQAVVRELGRKLPFWERDIDLMVLTHPHLDHISGQVEILQRYRVKQVLSADLSTDNPIFQEWLSQIQKNRIPLSYVRRGQMIYLDEEKTLEILNPNPNSETADQNELDDRGIVLKLTWGKISFLFTADIGIETETEMLKSRLDPGCTVLKVAHHGSAGSSSSLFLSSAHPQYAVISCGAANNFGHPAPAVLERLEFCTVYRTDLLGTLEFTTDGTRFWFKSGPK